MVAQRACFERASTAASVPARERAEAHPLHAFSCSRDRLRVLPVPLGLALPLLLRVRGEAQALGRRRSKGNELPRMALLS